MSEEADFERSLSEDEQNAVLQRFDYLVSDPDSPRAAQLSEVREALGEEMGRAIDLGEPLVRGAWDADASQWDRFVYWAARYLQRDDFHEDEIEWKLEIADLMAEAKTALLGSQEDWQERLKRAFGTGNQLTGWRTSASFLQWCREYPDEAAAAIKALWTGPDDVELRLGSFLDRFPRDVLSGPSGRLGIASQLLLAEDVYGYPFFKTTPIMKAFELTGNT